VNIPSETTAIADLGAETERVEPIAWLERLHGIVGVIVELPAAVLVLAEVVVLLVGVTWRYALHQPLVWSDELASILFLWLAMLGSVVAFQRGEHMRMTAVVGMLRPRQRALLDLIAIAAALTFLVLMVHPAVIFAEEEVWVRTPALGIVNTWRAAALPTGIVLMIVVGFIQIFRVGRVLGCDR
jgi:TRAP-type C4-dicarboxylate transport system permease small subunit